MIATGTYFVEVKILCRQVPDALPVDGSSRVVVLLRQSQLLRFCLQLGARAFGLTACSTAHLNISILIYNEVLEGYSTGNHSLKRYSLQLGLAWTLQFFLSLQSLIPRQCPGFDLGKLAFGYRLDLREFFRGGFPLFDHLLSEYLVLHVGRHIEVVYRVFLHTVVLVDLHYILVFLGLQ